jgi:threonine aldolase
LAVRILAGERRRVLVQAESHLFRDCGDCSQTLSGLHLVPLAPGKATFTMKDVQEAEGDSRTGRVLTPIGALQIETPVRRQRGARFDFDEMKRISAWARANKTGLHLDGARLFLECGYTGRAITEYTALFDTVYVSSYKYFNAASGAILAGPKALLSGLYHTRRMFGGGLPHAWPFAAVSLHYLEGFGQRYASAVKTSEAVIQALQRDSNFGVERIEAGTNIFRMRVFGVNAPVYQTRAAYAGLTLADPVAEWFNVQVNETWNRATAPEIVQRFVKGLG